MNGDELSKHIRLADAHPDETQRFIVRADDELTIFLALAARDKPRTTCVLVRLDHVVRFIVNANHSIM